MNILSSIKTNYFTWSNKDLTNEFTLLNQLNFWKIFISSITKVLFICFVSMISIIIIFIHKMPHNGLIFILICLSAMFIFSSLYYLDISIRKYRIKKELKKRNLI